MKVVLVHGGAGRWAPERHEAALKGLVAAVAVAWATLEKGGTAVDAAVDAAVTLEDNPLFNAGTGAKLNLDGDAEMDAAIMEGRTWRAGGVANLRGVKNPVLVARAVMDQTGHVMLGGEGAARFARALGFEPHDPVTPERRALHTTQVEKLKAGGKIGPQGLRDLLERYPELACGTIGVVVLDDSGLLAAATSTGGITLKMVGRIGDTPIPGAGNYATPFAAASATGRGELMMRALTTRDLCDRVEAGANAQQAATATLARMRETVGAHLGVIALDHKGEMGIAHGTANLPHAWQRTGMDSPLARMRHPGEDALVEAQETTPTP